MSRRGSQASQDIGIPIRRTRTRAESLLNYGGENSLTNFVGSVNRSVGYLSTSLEEEPGPLLETIQSESPSETSPLVTPTMGSVPVREASLSSINEEPLAKDEMVVIIAKRSTPIQTIFNSINVLIGLGILSIPLAFHLSGWIVGLIILTFAALTTSYTAVLLGRILNRVDNITSYQDIGVYVYGPGIGRFILFIFMLDLYGAGVSMIILFSDSFHALIPELSSAVLKVFVCTVLLFLNLLPLRCLSVLSLIGIICTTTTFFTIVACGLAKHTQPGSLLEPMPTNLFPESFKDLCFSLGLFLAPWGGHATFPEIYTDQGLPERYPHCMHVTFSFCYIVDLLTGVVGFLMFGSGVDAEVTRNILLAKGYSPSIKTLIVTLMGLLPISKLPLVCRPIITVVDRIGGSDTLTCKVFKRMLISLFYLVSSLLITSFGSIMSLLGSAICFTVCITLPVLFYLKVFYNEISVYNKLGLELLVGISVLCTIFGSLSVIV